MFEAVDVSTRSPKPGPIKKPAQWESLSGWLRKLFYSRNKREVFSNISDAPILWTSLREAINWPEMNTVILVSCWRHCKIYVVLHNRFGAKQDYLIRTN